MMMMIITDNKATDYISK